MSVRRWWRHLCANLQVSRHRRGCLVAACSANRRRDGPWRFPGLAKRFRCRKGDIFRGIGRWRHCLRAQGFWFLYDEPCTAFGAAHAQPACRNAALVNLVVTFAFWALDREHALLSPLSGIRDLRLRLSELI